jgi:hypothetical protein
VWKKTSPWGESDVFFPKYRRHLLAGKENSLESCALMLRGTRHEEGRGFGAKAVSFFELTQVDQATSGWAVY